MNPSNNSKYSPINRIQGKMITSDFVIFYKTYVASEKSRTLDWIIPSDDRYYEYLNAIHRAGTLKMSEINVVDAYPYKFSAHDLQNIETICTDWFAVLASEYTNVYKAIFRDDTYIHKGRFEYSLSLGSIFGQCHILALVARYSANNFSVLKNDLYRNSNIYDIVGAGASHCYDGFGMSDFITNGAPLYHSIKCLLYQGIAKAIGVKCEGVAFGMGRHRIFDY